MIAVFLHFFNLSVMAGWMVLAVLLLRLCLKKAPRWITCVLWGLVALRLLVPFTVESPISLIPTAETVVSGDAADTSAPIVNSGMAAIDKPLNDWLQTPLLPSDTDAGETTVNPKPPEQKPLGDTDETVKTVSRMERALSIAAPVWLVGIGLMLAYELVSVLRVRRRVLDAVLLRDNVWQSDRVSSPFIFGLFRPRIYVPYHLEESVLEQVLSHERAHLHRRDHWIKPFAFTLLAVYWYNPLLWVGCVLLCRDIEVACDERVVRGLDEDTRRQYATALLQCGVERRSIAACPLAFGEVSIKQRIRSVLNYRKPLLWVIIASLVACSVAAVCLLTVPSEGSVKVLSSEAIQPNQVRQFYGTDTDGALVEAGFHWLWEHAENPDAKTPDVDIIDETNIPLVVSRSKADLDALMEACSDETLQVDMRGSFELEKYDDAYFEDQAIVWLFVPGYDLATYDYVVTLEETNKGLRYAVTLQYNSTSMFNPWPGRCEYLLLFETDRKTIEEADSLTTRHQRAPIQLPTEEGLTMVPVGRADMDGDGEKEDIRLYHSEFDWDSGWYEIAYLVVCKKDGTPILKEDTLVYKYSQCYLVPQDDGSSLLLFVETDGVGEGDCEEFGVLSLEDGVRTVLQYRHDGRFYFNNLELGEVISYVSSLSDWLEKAELLYDCDSGSLYYGDTLSDTTPQYTPLCWLDTYRTDKDDTLQEILENVLASLNGTATPIGKMDFNEDGQADSLFVWGYRNGSFDEFCLLVRDTYGTILTTIPLHTYYSRIDNSTYLYRVTDSTGKEWLQNVTLFTDGTCSVSDLSMDGEANYRSMTMTEWLNTAAKTGAKMICYLEGNELYFTNGDSAAQSVKMDLPDDFLAVLQGEQAFVIDKDFFNGEAITLSRLLGKYDLDSIRRYTLVDMDTDNVPELVIAFNSQDDKLVIKKDGNNYYGHLYGFRGMYQLNQDGTYLWNKNAGKIHGCSRVRFNGTQRVETELWWEELNEDGTFNFFVDGKAVTKEEYLTVTAKLADEVPWAEWEDVPSVSDSPLSLTMEAAPAGALLYEDITVAEHNYTLALTAQKDLTQVRLVSLDPDSSMVDETLYTMPALTKGQCWYIRTYINDAVANRGVVCTDKQGTTYGFAFTYSGKGGSIRLQPLKNIDITTTITTKTDGTTMTDAELLALCKSKIQCAQQIEGWYMGGSRYTTTISEGTVTTLLNGETYVIEYDYYPLADDFYLDGAMHSGAVITAAALKQQIESVYTIAFANDRYYDDGYAWVEYKGDVYHVTADGVISEVVDPDSITDIQAEKDTITFRVKVYGHGDGEEVDREMKLTYVEGNWKFDELV